MTKVRPRGIVVKNIKESEWNLLAELKIIKPDSRSVIRDFEAVNNAKVAMMERMKNEPDDILMWIPLRFQTALGASVIGFQSHYKIKVSRKHPKKKQHRNYKQH